MTAVTKQPGELDHAFRARAFAINRQLCGLRPQATPITVEDIKARGTQFPEPVRLTRLRAIWYGAGLVFGATLIGMGVTL